MKMETEDIDGSIKNYWTIIRINNSFIYINMKLYIIFEGESSPSFFMRKEVICIKIVKNLQIIFIYLMIKFLKD